MDGSRRISLGEQEGSSLGEAARSSSSWHDPYMSSKGPKVDQTGSFDLEFASTAKFEEHELGVDGFTRADGFHDTGHWSRFSPATAPLPGLGAQFDSKNMSSSPETSETTTPPSVPGIFDHHLRGSGINEDLMLTPRDGFSSGTDEFWNGKMDEFDRKQIQNSNSLHLPYPGADASFGTQATLPPLRSIPAIGQGFSFSPNAPPYGSQLPPYMGQNPHQAPLGKDHSSRPPTANSSSSSGSSTPFVNANLFDNPQANWRGFGARPAEHSYFEWNMGTCDPRGITAPKYDLATMQDADPSLSMTLSNQPPFASPASSPASESQDANKRVRGRPRRSDSGLETQFPTGDEGSVYRAKKRSIEESGGMGLEDIDERTLQFTSRQDAKPTRTLRRQCFNCRTWRDVSAWRRSVMQVGHIVCNKCGLYEKAHKKARPLNERGEFVRPGKHIPKVAAKGVVGRARPKSRGTAEPVAGAGVMKFETDGDNSSAK